MPVAIRMDSTESRAVPSQERATNFYAELALNKALWAMSPIGDQSSRHLDAGKLAGDRLIGTPAADLDEVTLKLTELAEWIAPDVTPGAFRLLRGAIDDVLRLSGRAPGWVGAPAEKPESFDPGYLDQRIKEGNARLNPRQPAGGCRCRPITVDGVSYRSITAAARATGIPYQQLRQMSA